MNLSSAGIYANSSRIIWRKFFVYELIVEIYDSVLLSYEKIHKY